MPTESNVDSLECLRVLAWAWKKSGNPEAPEVQQVIENAKFQLSHDATIEDDLLLEFNAVLDSLGPYFFGFTIEKLLLEPDSSESDIETRLRGCLEANEFIKSAKPPISFYLRRGKLVHGLTAAVSAARHVEREPVRDSDLTISGRNGCLHRYKSG